MERIETQNITNTIYLSKQQKLLFNKQRVHREAQAGGFNVFSFELCLKIVKDFLIILIQTVQRLHCRIREYWNIQDKGYVTITIWISHTFVLVGPVLSSESTFSKKEYESLFCRYFAASMFISLLF